MVDYYKGVEDAAVLEWDVSAEACSTVWEAVEEKLTRQLAALMAEQAQARRSRAWRCSSSVSRLIDDAVYVAEAWASGVPPVSASHRRRSTTLCSEASWDVQVKTYPFSGHAFSIVEGVCFVCVRVYA